MASFALGRRLTLVLPYVISAAAGALLGTAVAHLLPEAIRQVGTGRELTLFLLIGLLGSFLLERSLWMVFEKDAQEHGHSSRRPLAANILVGGAAHSFIDGIAIATGFAVGHNVGIATSIAVLLHEVPHHIADVGVLIYTGFDKSRAVLLNLLATCGCITGGVLVLLLGARIKSLVPALLPITAANFLYIALAILLPEVQREKNGRRSLIQSACLLGSAALMCALSQFVRD